MKRILTCLIIAASVVVVISFFLPWAKVSVSAVGVSKELTDIADKKLGDTPIAGKVIDRLKKVTGAISSFGDIDVKTTVTGYQIPKLVNDKTSKVAISLVGIMFKSAEGLEWKSYLVYLLPLLGILCAGLAVLGLKNNIYVILMLVVSGVVSLAGLYNLHTANVESIAVKVSIESGLWNTMYALCFIFLVSILWLILDRKK
ncbi:MAG: hypothetical protein WBC74_04930 [Candidatus Omnitrophota bacterium]